ncbi:MAG TPA: ABC transporter permease, partial [Dehalococcoidia bacterium]|nr:ABC transporter permease [Dehalococcoidia bacterium]
SVERQEAEIALLRGRGASLGQIVAVYAVEGAILALPCVLLAPFLAALFVHLLGATPVFHGITHGSLIPVTVPLLSFALALLGAALSLAALVGPALIVSGFRGVALRRFLGRPQPSFVRRYYLDLGLLGLAGILLWEINQKGSVYTPGTAGGLSSDPLLLATPALLTLAIAALVLRFYPLALRAAGWLFAAGSGVTVVLGIWQMTRNPGQYTRLGLLLMMGLAVGAFASTYSDTANRSFSDRAHYAAGVDLSASGGDVGNGLSPDQEDAQLRQIPGVANASGVLRLTAAPAGAGATNESLQVLALDPQAARSMLWYRKGLSKDSLDTLMNDLGTPSQQIGIPLPGQPAQFTAWVNPTAPLENATVWARFRDADGHYKMYELGKLNFTGWQQMTAQIGGNLDTPKFPIALVSIVLSEPSNFLVVKRQPIYFDDFAAVQPDGTSQVVEDFEGLDRWSAAPTTTLNADQAVIATDSKHGGARALVFTPQQGDSTGIRGIYVNDGNVPLPAVVSRPLANAIGGVGKVTYIVIGGVMTPIRVTGVADLFPTLDPNAGWFVLLNRAHLLEWQNRMADSPNNHANEFWFSLVPGADRVAVESKLAQNPFGLGNFVDLNTELQLDGADPLIGAGGSGILFVAFVALLVLIAGAFLTSLYASLQRRRIEFAVMAALGLRRRKVFALIAFEYTVVTAIGVATGLALGLAISRLMLSFLDSTANGTKVVPPFVLQTNWNALGVALGCLALIVAGSIAAGVRLFTDKAAGAVLRITE